MVLLNVTKTRFVLSHYNDLICVLHPFQEHFTYTMAFSNTVGENQTCTQIPGGRNGIQDHHQVVIGPFHIPPDRKSPRTGLELTGSAVVRG